MTVPEETVLRAQSIVAQHRGRPSTSDRWIAERVCEAILTPTPAATGSIVDLALSDTLAELREIIPELAASDLFVLTNPPVVGIVQALRRPCDACGHRNHTYPGWEAEEGATGVSEQTSDQGEAA